MTITNNTINLQFEIELKGEKAFLLYRWYRGDLALMHTFVPVILRKQGIASRLAKEALEFAKAKEIKVMVYCPYVSSFIKKNPEYEYLKDKKYHP